MTNCLTYHFDLNYLGRLLSSLPSLVWPISLRKIWCWFTYTMILLLLWGDVLNMDSLWEELKKFIKWHSLEFALFILLIDPVVITAGILLTRYPPMVSPRPRSSELNDSNDVEVCNKLDNIGIVIPSHHSAAFIRPTIEACLKHVNGCQIFICDNGDSDQPSDLTPDEIRRIDPTINYHYNPMPNKTRAQYMGIMSRQNRYKYTMLIDDDVILPENLHLNLDMLEEDDNTQCLVYPISGLGDNNLFVKWQDLEYKLSGLVKNFQSSYGTVVAPHGGISVWKTPILKRILVEGDTVFYGDDTKMGLYLLNRGFYSKFVSGPTVPTRVPSSLMGQIPNLFNQRVCSWDSTEHLLTPRFIETFFRSYVRGSITRTLISKFFVLKILLDILSDWVKIIVLVYFCQTEKFWAWLGLSVLINILVIFAWNYIKCWNRPDLKTDLLTVSTFWAYKVLTSLFRVFGLIRCYFFYLPNFKQPKIIALEDDTQSDPVTPWRWSERQTFLRNLQSTHGSTSDSSDARTASEEAI